MRRKTIIFSVLGGLLLLGCGRHAPLPVKVVVVTMFERGADTGDEPGEFQFWVERQILNTNYALPSGYRDLRANDEGVLGIVTGMGTTRAAASIMALGTDPRFDLTKAYWLVAGIGGVDPADASLGSAVWAEWVVDGDLAHEIDAREIPRDWPTGYLPLRKSAPYQLPRKADDQGEVYRLDPVLVDWAYQLSKNVDLPDTEAMRTMRANYTGYPNAQRPPFVLKGDTIASKNFWHGKLMNARANDWVKYYSNGKGNYVIAGMEDTGTLEALTFLSKAGKVDLRRAMVLRTASNYDMQAPGSTAAESLAAQKIGHYSAYVPALEAAYRAGSVVVRELVTKWTNYKETRPGK